MNYYELRYLKQLLKIKLAGCQLTYCYTRFKNNLEFFIEKEEESFRLIFSSTPGNIALFIDKESNIKQRNTISFFDELKGQEITGVELAETDRVLFLEFESGLKLWFKLFSNRANVLLVDKNKVLESFKGGNNEEIELPQIRKIDLYAGSVSEVKGTRKKILHINSLIPRDNLDDLIKEHQLHTLSDAEIIEFTKKMIQKLEENPDFRLLENGKTTLFNEQILPTKTERRFEGINELIAYRFKTYSHNQRLNQRKGEWIKRLNRQKKRIQSSLKNLNQADKGLERAEKYEKYGHLLMANGHLKVSGEGSIEVDDLYDEGKKISIPLNTELSLIENAERYYEKAKSSITSYEQAIERLPVLEKRFEQTTELQSDVENISRFRGLQDWEKQNASLLQQLGLKENRQSSSNEVPFYTLEIEGYPVWIGKSAKNNDLLVQMGHKEDIWLHARGFSGSHVLIRMGNRNDYPAKSIVIEAASYAAYYSKTKGSEVVPVIFTKKKFVRKPKGAAYGAVIVQREEVEFVTPKKPSL